MTKHVTIPPANVLPISPAVVIAQPPVLKQPLPVKFVERWQDRLGKMVYYFRLKGGPRTRLPDLHHPDFVEAYRTALKGSAAAIQTGNHDIGAGTVEAALIAYYQSSAWTQDLAEASRKGRKTTLENFRKRYGTDKLRNLKDHHIRTIVKDLSQPMQAQWRKSLRHFFAWCVEEKLMKEDVTQGVKIKRRKTGTGAKTWGEEQLAQYRKVHKLGTMARLAIEIMAGTGVRVSDAGRIGKVHLDTDNVLHFKPKKTSNSTGAEITVHLQADLLKAIKAMKVTGPRTYLVTDTGKAFTGDYLRKHVRAWCNEAGLADCSSHGLRKLCLSRLAEDGADLKVLQAVSGDRDLAVLQKYIDAADLKKAAARGAKLMKKRKAA